MTFCPYARTCAFPSRLASSVRLRSSPSETDVGVFHLRAERNLLWCAGRCILLQFEIGETAVGEATDASFGPVTCVLMTRSPLRAGRTRDRTDETFDKSSTGVGRVSVRNRGSKCCNGSTETSFEYFYLAGLRWQWPVRWFEYGRGLWDVVAEVDELFVQ